MIFVGDRTHLPDYSRPGVYNLSAKKELWDKLTDEQKKVYEERSHEDRVRFLQEMVNYCEDMKKVAKKRLPSYIPGYTDSEVSEPENEYDK